MIISVLSWKKSFIIVVILLLGGKLSWFKILFFLKGKLKFGFRIGVLRKGNKIRNVMKLVF